MRHGNIQTIQPDDLQHVQQMLLSYLARTVGGGQQTS